MLVNRPDEVTKYPTKYAKNLGSTRHFPGDMNAAEKCRE